MPMLKVRLVLEYLKLEVNLDPLYFNLLARKIFTFVVQSNSYSFIKTATPKYFINFLK